MSFFKQFFVELKNNGVKIELACSLSRPLEDDIVDLELKTHDISFSRSPFSKDNINAYKQLKKLIESGNYDIVHCHTPIAAMCTRLSCRKARRNGTKVFYTAHGFHFYKGAPLKNWLLFYPAEKLCAHFTDTLITINKEDYDLACRKLKAQQILYIPGVGVDLAAFTPEQTVCLRRELGIPENNRVLLSVGELSHRKNHRVLIRAAAGIPNATVLIAGAGTLEDELKRLAQETGCDIRFLGYRKDIAALCGACDLFVLPSFQEGLPVALMEAMACAKAVSCSAIRGNVDLVDGDGGTLFDPADVDSCRTALVTALNSDLSAMGQHNRQVMQAFSIEEVNRQMLELYAL